MPTRDRSLIPDYFLTMLDLMLKARHPVRTLNERLHALIQTELPKCNPHG
jgi:hypothetical protein